MRRNGALQWMTDLTVRYSFTTVGLTFSQVGMQIVLHTWLTLAEIDHLHMSWQIQTHSRVHFQFAPFLIQMTHSDTDLILQARLNWKNVCW